MLLFCKNLILLKNLCHHKLLYSLRLRYSNLIKSRAKVIPKICSVLYRSYATLVSSLEAMLFQLSYMQMSKKQLWKMSLLVYLEDKHKISSQIQQKYACKVTKKTTPTQKL